MCNRPLISLTATVLRKSGEPTMQGTVLWTHHQYPAGKLPRKWLTNYQALKWERYCPPYLLSWLMHCCGMHIDTNFEINIIVVVNVYIKFFLPLQELGRCFRGIWRYWRRATDINLDTLKEVIKFWSTVENSYNRQVSLTVHVHTTHKHQPHASLSYLVTWLLLTSTTGLVKLHKGLVGGSWSGCAHIAPRGVAPGVTCNPQACRQCGEPDALINTISGPVPGSPATHWSYPSQPLVILARIPKWRIQTWRENTNQPLLCAKGGGRERKETQRVPAAAFKSHEVDWQTATVHMR